MSTPEQPERNGLEKYTKDELAFIEEHCRLMDEVHKAVRALAAHARSVPKEKQNPQWYWLSAVEYEVPEEDRVWLAVGRLKDMARGVESVREHIRKGDVHE